MRLTAVDVKIDRLSNLLAETTAPAPLLRKIESLKDERAALQRQIETATRQVAALRQLEAKDVKSIIESINDAGSG